MIVLVIVRGIILPVPSFPLVSGSPPGIFLRVTNIGFLFPYADKSSVGIEHPEDNLIFTCGAIHISG